MAPSCIVLSWKTQKEQTFSFRCFYKNTNTICEDCVNYNFHCSKNKRKKKRADRNKKEERFWLMVLVHHARGSETGPRSSPLKGKWNEFYSALASCFSPFVLSGPSSLGSEPSSCRAALSIMINLWKQLLSCTQRCALLISQVLFYVIKLVNQD